MTTLTKAPLIVSIVEIRWGHYKKVPSDTIEFAFAPADSDFFPGQFQAIAKKEGFAFIEHPNKDAPPLPHIVKFRFRRQENTWPCYQIGLGILTINQVNEGYDWETFKTDSLKGISMLNDGHPVGLQNLPVIGIEMRYQDGFLFEEGESSFDFLRNKMNIEFKLPSDFHSSPILTSNFKGNLLSFSIQSAKPKGVVLISLVEGLINGLPGFVMDTSVRSSDDNKPAFDVTSISSWLDEAHEIQRHTFKTLINPTYMKSFRED